MLSQTESDLPIIVQKRIQEEVREFKTHEISKDPVETLRMCDRMLGFLHFYRTGWVSESLNVSMNLKFP